MKNLFMGIDTGTQGVRIGICDENGNIKSESEKKWNTNFPKLGWVEQNPDVWRDNIFKAIEECLKPLNKEEKNSIKCCCVCATSSTVIAVNKNGDPLIPAIMWMDARSKKEMKEINDTHHKVLSYCGNEVSFEWFIPKALWIKHNRPEIYNKSYKIVEQLDWINHLLTGVWSASICNASCKWNYVQSKGGFSKDFFEQIGLKIMKRN